MGFSPIGMLVAIAVMAPSLLLLVFPPPSGLPETRVPFVLHMIERIGQALCMAMAVFIPAGSLWWPWSVPMLLALLGYYALWYRYIASNRNLELLFQSWWHIPVPMAILPVLVFLFAAAWLRNPWLAVAAVIFAAGHIPVSVITSRDK